MVVRTAPNPYAALLFLEHEASPEGQKIIDDYEPIKSNLHSGGEISRIVQGKKISVNDHKTFHNTPRWMQMVTGHMLRALQPAMDFHPMASTRG